jgi:hypothetical protein
MPGGRYDSSKTRVVPVFDALRTRDDDWIRSLIRLPEGGGRQPDLDGLDLVFEEGFWGASERGLQPPLSLLDWLIENVKRPVRSTTHHPFRERLFDRDPDVMREAQRLLRSRGRTRGWYVFEGLTYPDAFLVTPSALIVVEGKRTEAGPTADTTWLKGRHQMWRHINAAWEIRGQRQVFGFFVVEAARGAPALPSFGNKLSAIPLTRRSCTRACLTAQPKSASTSRCAFSGNDLAAPVRALLAG